MVESPNPHWSCEGSPKLCGWAGLFHSSRYCCVKLLDNFGKLFVSDTCDMRRQSWLRRANGWQLAEQGTHWTQQTSQFLYWIHSSHGQTSSIPWPTAMGLEHVNKDRECFQLSMPSQSTFPAEHMVCWTSVQSANTFTVCLYFCMVHPSFCKLY